jgi:hypothetical protein
MRSGVEFGAMNRAKPKIDWDSYQELNNENTRKFPHSKVWAEIAFSHWHGENSSAGQNRNAGASGRETRKPFLGQGRQWR